MSGYEIEGKVALITGAATGIGLCYARELLKNGLRAVTIADLDERKGSEAVESITKEFGSNKANFIKTDVTKAEQLEAAFKSATSTWKQLDIVINNAGIMNDASWELEIAINSTAVVRGSLLAIEYLKKYGGGTVVNIASILGLQQLEGCPIYVGTKHFVIGLTRSFGTDYHYKLTGVRFLTMCPGVTITPLITDAGQKAHLGGDRLPFYQGLGNRLAEQLGSLPDQPPECVAKGMVTLIKQGNNGSVWVCEGKEPIYEVDIPDRATIRKH